MGNKLSHAPTQWKASCVLLPRLLGLYDESESALYNAPHTFHVSLQHVQMDDSSVTVQGLLWVTTVSAMAICVME